MICNLCKILVDERDDTNWTCNMSVGQYGAIVIGTITCPKCGFKLKEEIVDNDGNIPPRR